jgi:glycosyltransferase involved in cell wall biosynthesis
MIFFGKKTILQIRDNKAYAPTGNMCVIHKILSIIRGAFLSRVHGIAFESKTLMKNYLENNGKYRSKCFTSYVYYPDVYEISTRPTRNGIINIGLLGTISDYRKDYSLLIDALRKISLNDRLRMKIWILGACDDCDNQSIILIKELVEVRCKIGYLEDAEFIHMGGACDFLISPLNKNLNYGATKGTGAFGDAINLKKKVMIPMWADIEREFSSFALYYSDAESLAEKLRMVLDQPNIVDIENAKDTFKEFESKLVAEKMASSIFK